MLVFFLFSSCSDQEKLNKLIEKKQYTKARLLLENKLLPKDADCCHFSQFLLNLRTSDTLINTTLLNLANHYHFETNAQESQLFSEKDIELLLNQLSATESHQISSALQKLSASSVPFSLREKMLKQLWMKAEKEQLIAGYNNYLILNDNINNTTLKKIITKKRLLLQNIESFKKQGIQLDSFLAYNPCYTPLLKKTDRVFKRSFTFKQLYNSNFQGNQLFAGRYIFTDLNTLDEQGNCRGTFDINPDNEHLSEFKKLFTFLKKMNINIYDLDKIKTWEEKLVFETESELKLAAIDWLNYLSRVEKFRSQPYEKPAIAMVSGAEHCFGQRLCLCEIEEDTIKLVAQFITSSKNATAPHVALNDYDGQPRYYAPLCYIGSRFWVQDIPYELEDSERDKRMGGGFASVARYRGRVPLPNFMRMIPANDYPGAMGFVNGIHEFAVGGNGPEKYMGTPASLGCIRLYDYASRFVRWWTPMNANMFIHYEYEQYRRFPRFVEATVTASY